MRIFKLVCMTLAFWGAAFKAEAREIVIGISPYLSQTEHQKTAQELVGFLIGLEGGDKAMLIDAYHLTTIGEFIVPEGETYRHPKARIAKNRAVIAALMNLPNSVPADAARPAVAGAVLLPQFLRHVAGQYQGSEKVDILIIGAPFYDSPADAALSMADGLVPGDGHIRASRQNSLYGTVETPEALKNLRVHFALVGDRSFLNDMHDFYLTRFWTLYVSAMQGKLVSFTADLKTVFSNVKTGREPLPNAFKLEETDRLEMIRVRKIELQSSIYQRPLSTTKLTAQQLRRSFVEIGLSWGCVHCDLDLHARPHPDAQTLSFSNTRTAEGVYYKDFQKSPRSTNGFETIEFLVPVDLETLRIAVHFFAGAAPNGVDGELRITVDGNTYAKSFHIPASSGNAGAFVMGFNSSRRNNPHVVLFSPLDILPR